MRTIQIHFLSVTALAFLALAGNSAAQDKSPALLNSLEVQQLVKRAEPGDNARLAGHFTALAERYLAEAKRHTSMSQGFVGNPSRNLGTGVSAHCKRLADLNTQSATALRELAIYHQKRAAGASATAPTTGARFEGGAGAPAPTDQELNAMAAKASTPADHHGLEEYFLTSAKRYTAEGKEHVAMAAAYRGTRIAQAAVHCDRLIELSRDSAKEAAEAAAMHKQLAGVNR
jgi:hypothetical protein